MLPRMRIELGKGRRAIHGQITVFMETLIFLLEISTIYAGIASRA